MASLSPIRIEQFHQDGYLVLHDAILAGRLKALQQVVTAEVEQQARRMHTAGEISELRSEDSFDQRWFQVWRQRSGEQDVIVGWSACMFSKALFELWVHEGIVEPLIDLLGPEIQFNGDFWIRPKLPAEKITTAPWHQDAGYTRDTAQFTMLTAWFPLVPVTRENGALQFVPGSHNLGIQEYKKPPGEIFSVSEFDPTEDEIVTLEMEPGDLVIFNNLVFHRSTINAAETVRWSVDFRYSHIGTPLDHLFHGGMVFPVSSAEQPDSVADWEQIQAQWAESDWTDKYP